MNHSAVKQLADLFVAAGLTTLSYEDAEFKLTLSNAPIAAGQAAAIQLPSIPVAEQRVRNVNPIITTTDDVVTDYSAEALVTVTSPVVGTAYRAREPGKSPIVSLGDIVRAGDPLCVIEAMKVFNDITAPCDGTVVEISFEDGTLAEYGAKLIVLERADGSTP